MKFKLDFVTNSSSTSYTIIGVNSDNVMKKVVESILGKVFPGGESGDFMESDEWCDFTNDTGGYGVSYLNDLEIVYYSGIIGLNVEKLLVEENLNFEQMKDKIMEEFKKYGINLKREAIRLHSGEASNEY